MRRRFPTKRGFLYSLAAALGLVILSPGTAYAYLDPGTGSMLLSAGIGIAATLFFMIKTFYYKAAGILYRLTGATAPETEKDSIVFYSEGKQYWRTFKPVLEALDAAGEKAVYLTSGEDDPGLAHPFTHITARYIGSGNRAFAALNMLEAAVCVSTTPGLDVLQIRRSPGVRHYAHLVHAPTDAAIYKLYSFDYFDSVLCSGPHQIKSLRFLENARNTPRKQLLETGCLYMDALAEELEAANTRTTKTAKNCDATTPLRILVAPTWGSNGLLARFGVEFLESLAKAGFSVTIRPHPQSRVVESDLLNAIETRLAPFPNVAWDHDPSSLPAMLGSDVLLSDLSGIVFDYAFILERPVVTIAMDIDTRGLEAGDLPWSAWELEKLPELGASLSPEKIAELPAVIAALPSTEDFSQAMRRMRAESLYNYRSGGVIAAQQILQLRRDALEPPLDSR